MSALTIGLVAATLVSLVVYRIRHSRLEARGKLGTGAAGGKKIAPFSPGEDAANRTKETVIVSPMQDLEDLLIVVLTVLFTLTALYIMLSGQYGVGEQEFAAGVMGTVAGFWFRAKRKS